MRRLPTIALAVLAVLAAACGDGSGDDRLVLTPVEADYLPVVVSADLALGENRFVLGLIDQRDESQVLGAQLHLRFFLLNGQQATLKSEADAEPIRITRSYTHTHEDGTVETHEVGETGVYVTNVEFDTAGQWGVEVTGTVNGEEMEPVRPVFDVLQESEAIALGEPAPRSVQPILSDVGNIAEIDTSEKPIAEMHNMTIADAVASGRPTVIVFATPAFCVTQICGPTKQIVDDLFGTYGSQANFIHVEPYDIEKARSGAGLEPLPFIVSEWGLTTEPWVFIVNREGNIAAKFEGAVSFEELEDGLRPLL